MTVFLGRNAKMYKAGVVVAYAKNIKVQVTAELIKDYSMDAVAPAVIGAGKQTVTWSISKLYEATSLLADLVAGTKFVLVFASNGSSAVAPYTTLTDAVILSWNKTAGETGGILSDISGEATSAVETLT
jgi:hypothetical protein